MSVDQGTLDALSGLLTMDDWVEAMASESYAELLGRLRDVAAPSLTVEMVGPGGAFRQSFHGVDGFREAWADWLEPYESYRLEPEDWRQAPDRLVFLGRQRAIPKGGGGEIANDAAAVLFFAEGKLSRIEFHLDRAAALRSAGLAPD